MNRDPALPGAQLAAGVDAFQVDEIPLYEPCGDGPHWYVRVRKRGVGARALVEAVADAAGVRDRDIGMAGMKDRDAVTTQWLSVPVDGSVAPERWPLPDGIDVVDVSRHTNKLRTGHLAGNRFRLTLEGVDEASLATMEPALESLRTRGFANAYGGQRFGREGRGLVRALSVLGARGKRSGRGARFGDRLHVSIVQAAIFNRYLELRRTLGFDRLIDGEFVRLQGSRSGFRVDDVAAEQARLDDGDLVLTGPLPGPKLRPDSRGPALRLERAALWSLGVGPRLQARLGKSGKPHP